MTNLKVKNDHFENGFEDLQSYCDWLKRKNSVALFKIEKYANKKLSDDVKLSEIRNLILDVSNDISRLPSIIMNGDKNEELQ